MSDNDKEQHHIPSSEVQTASDDDASMGDSSVLQLLQDISAERASGISTIMADQDKDGTNEKLVDGKEVAKEPSSQPGAFPVAGVSSSLEASSHRASRGGGGPSSAPPPLPAANAVGSDVLVSAELVDETAVAVSANTGDMVESGQAKLVEAKPLEQDQPITLKALWKNRTVRIIVVVAILMIIGLVIGLVVGLQSATRPIELDDSGDSNPNNDD